MDDEASSVRVAVRIRPQLSREIIDACKICTYKTPGEPQAWIGSDKSFTYDYVFDTTSQQAELYEETVAQLIEGCFEGYNATVLAYGQTGSGKTFSMGTGFELDLPPEMLGIIPRAVRHLFDGITQRQEEARENEQTPPEFKVSLQFMELYNEEILDLFDPNTSKAKKSGIRIHEDANGGIYTIGVTNRTVKSEEETLNCLRSGAFNRTTASTNMNDQSSRSHAIFTLYIQQQRQAKKPSFGDDIDDLEVMPSNDDFENLTAKFHFVDLAGSERLKRTGATGDRAKEGISINCGLLALGNVISALGDESRKASHVPYRDSKLTRLLQDSLGGNSRTLMIACVSPSDRDFMETLNTLKYANRARNIRNKVTANQDKTSRTIMQLRAEIQNLQLEIMEYKQGKRLVGDEGDEGINDMYHENKLLSKETQNLRTRIKAMQETIEHLTSKNAQLMAEKEAGNWISTGSGGETNGDITGMISKYMSEIEDLRTKLCQSENLCEQLRKENSKVKRLSTGLANGSMHNAPWLNDSTHEESGYSVKELIEIAKTELERKREKMRKNSLKHEDDKSNSKLDDEKDVDESLLTDDLEEGGEHADDEDDSDTDTESDSKANQLDEELVELTSEISLKQKLIEELENSQKRMEIMKNQYENKLCELQKRILSTQDERDKVLKNLAGSRGSPPTQQISKIKVEYQEKLDRLQNELKKLQAAKKEHAKLLKNQDQYEKQLTKLKCDVQDMKKSKVRLVQQMREETNRHREAELRKNRELAQLKKVSRKNESKIKNLETEKRMKDTILKRKQEEVMSLRKTQRKISTMARKAEKFSTKNAKVKWTSIEKKITKVALNKQAVSQMENDMDRWLQEREKLSHRLDKLSQKRRRLLIEKGDSSLVLDLDDQMESVRANINYLHDNIQECQQNILQMEQAAGQEEEDEEDETKKILDISELQPEEAKYLLEKLLTMTVNQTCLATNQEGRIKELDNQIQQAHRQNAMHQQLLQHMIEQQDLEIYDLMLQNEEDDSCESDVEIERPTLKLPMVASVKVDEDTGTGSDSSIGRREKARRRNLNKDELLFNDTDMPTMSGEHLMLPPKPMSRLPKSVSNLNGTAQVSKKVPFSRSLSFTRAPTGPLTRSYSFTKNPPPGENLMTMSMDQATMNRLAPVYQPSPVLGRRSLDRQSMRKYNSTARLDESPPGSPSAYRRSNSREESSGKNVFSRLIAGTNIGEKKSISKGVINPYQGRIGGKSPLICTNVAEGHNRPVLSVYATDELLFSASKDQTVKVWDLCRGEEVQSLEGHPNNVVCVKYSQPQRIVYTVSSAFIKVWDLRMNPSSCIKTLSSSGLTTNGSVVMSNGSSSTRSLAMPPGETQINDICLTPSGYGLFSAAADKVRIWDLRKFHSIGKLSGGHQAAIMCLATGPTGPSHHMDTNYVITGSKDHYIKVFDVPENKGGVITPKISLDPPHYDGIQCMTISGDTLFSASRDMCIKKWNLQTEELVKSLNNAHKDWVCGLSFLHGLNLVISGCRGGIIKLWSTESCALVGEMKAHNSTINTITTNSSHIFTASNDGHIGMWRVRQTFDKSPDSESS